jgi:hypothetical protein
MIDRMERAAFDRMKAEIMRDCPPSGGDDLLGMEIDFTAYLGDLGVLDDAEARRTDDPQRLIVATGVAKPDATPEQVVAALDDVWSTKLRYSHREGHVITQEPGSVRLAAITRIAPGGFYVTAEVTVTWTQMS